MIEYASGYDPQIGVARRLTDEEKRQYLEWFAESGFIAVGEQTYLRTLKLDDMPKRASDGTFLGTSNKVWIITPGEYDNYIQADADRGEAIEQTEAEEKAAGSAKIQQEAEEKDVLIARVDEWTIEEKTIIDEGGKTVLCKHHFVVGGKSFDYTERSVFDFGVIINPSYRITDDSPSGGIALMKDGKLQWHVLLEDGGWVPVRPLTESEKTCYDIIARYGKFAKSAIRM